MSDLHMPLSWQQMSDEELAKHCAAEMGACLEELVGRYDRRIRDCATRMSIRREDAEDLAAEIYLRLVASVPRFEGRSAFGTWLYRLAHNTCIDAYRREARRYSHLAGPGVLRLSMQEQGSGTADLVDLLPAAWGDPCEALEEQIRECYLGGALSRLPDDYRRIVLLRFSEGRSNEEVAAILGTTVDSVKAKLQRARRRLKEDLFTRRRCPFCERAGSFQIDEEGGVQ